MAARHADRYAGIALAICGAIIAVPFVAVAIVSGFSSAIDWVGFVAEDAAGSRDFYGYWALMSVTAVAGGVAYVSGCARTRIGARLLFALSLALVGASMLMGLWVLTVMLGAASLLAFQARNGA